MTCRAGGTSAFCASVMPVTAGSTRLRDQTRLCSAISPSSLRLVASGRSSQAARMVANSVAPPSAGTMRADRSEEHTSELQSLMRISYAVFCLKKKNINQTFTLNHTLQEPTNHHHLHHQRP